MEIYETIKEIRLQKSINQQVIADSLGVDVAVISNIERGKRDLKVKELEIISNTLGINVIDLFTYPDKYVLAVTNDKANANDSSTIQNLRDEIIALRAENDVLREINGLKRREKIA